MGKKVKVTAEVLDEMVEGKEDEQLKFLKRKWKDGAGLAKALGADPEKGLKAPTEAELEERREEFGANVMPEPKTENIFEMFLDEIKDPIIILLIVCAVVSIVLALAVPREGEEAAWVDGVAIMAAVVIVTFVAVAQNYSKEQKFRKLNQVKNDRQVKVWRGGKTPDEMSMTQLVVGDVVELATGDFVPADGVFLQGDALSVDESPMTGEPAAKNKTDSKPFMVSGCLVATGSGRFVVTHVGEQSQWGALYSTLAQRESSQTPLEENLEQLAKLIGYFGFGVAILLFIVLSIWWLALFAAGDKTGSDATDFLDYLIQSIVIIVVAVPEGLPLAVTISLAFSMSSMLKDQNLVRKLAACETMGGATQICSDKTGTLTQNRMTVAAYWGGGHLGTSKKAFAKKVKRDQPESGINLFAQAVSVNSNAYLKVAEHAEDDEGAGVVTAENATALEFVGNKTECALLVLARNLGHEYTNIRESSTVLKTIPFSSDRKRMSTVVASKDPSKALLYSKGASEIVLGLCNSYVGLDGTNKKLTRDVRKQVEANIESLAAKGLRTLCIAYRVLSDDKVGALDKVGEEVESNLTLISMVGIEDPLRPEVTKAITQCKSAGITVRMVTGDNKLTAQKIAQDCGIYDPDEDHIVMEGPVFRKLTDAQLDSILPRLTVLARSKPNDKLRLVKRLRSHKEVVAVTGDGTNDSPALKAADVGMAMGIAGTEIAKEASDIIIMDDNFASIVAAVKWGRNVRASIQKFLQFQITINIVALTIAFIGAVTGYGEPLKPIQLLWVNMQMDWLAALALATDKPQDTLLDQAPAGRRVRLINGGMWRNIFAGGLFELIVLLLIMYLPSWGSLLVEYPEDNCQTSLVNTNAPESTFVAADTQDIACLPRDVKTTHSATIRYTFLFNTFVWLQFFNEINCRRIYEANVFENFWRNKIFLGVLAFTAVLQFLFMLGGEPLGVVVWGPDDALRATILWLLAIGLGILILPWGLFVRSCIPIWEPDWMIYSKAGLEDEEGDGAEFSDDGSSSEYISDEVALDDSDNGSDSDSSSDDNEDKPAPSKKGKGAAAAAAASSKSAKSAKSSSSKSGDKKAEKADSKVAKGGKKEAAPAAKSSKSKKSKKEATEDEEEAVELESDSSSSSAESASASGSGSSESSSSDSGSGSGSGSSSSGSGSDSDSDSD